MLDSKSLRELTYYLPDKTSTNKLADFFGVFADANRLRLLSALAITQMCVSDISQILELNQTTVSHQLRLLKSQGVVTAERKGKLINYRLTDTKINEVLLAGVNSLDM